MRSLTVEPMVLADLDAVLAIERASFTAPWSRSAFVHELQQNRAARCWVARVGAELVGYLCLWEVGPELHITNVAVHPGWRRRGVARTLLGDILEEARGRSLTTAFLEVRPTNHEARGLYEHFGFQVIGQRKGYYVDTGEDALIMEADLTAGATRNHPRREEVY